MSNFAINLKTIRSKKRLKQDELAVLVGITSGTLSNYEVGKTEPNLDTLVNFSSALGISIDILLNADASLIEKIANEKDNGKASLNASPYASLMEQNSVKEATLSYNRSPAVVTVDRAGNETITHVPIKARAGYLAGYQDPEFISKLPTYSFPGMNNATFRMWEIDGHSMIPTFDDSDIIIGRFIENLGQIRDGRVHVVVTKNDGILIKRLINRAESDGKLILNSDNQRTVKEHQEYPPIVIDADEVIEIWYGVAKFTRQMRAPSEVHNKLIDLEARLTLLEHSKRI